MKRIFCRKSRLFSICMIVFLMLLVVACSSPHDPLVTKIDNGWNNLYIQSIGVGGGSDYYAQSFTANTSTITKIGVVIQQRNSVGQIMIGLAADNGGVPNYAAPLYMGASVTPTTTGAWYYETGINVPVTKGQKYFILLDGYNPPGGSGTAAIGTSDVQPISGEGIIWSNFGGSGAWESDPSRPLAIYVEGY